MGGRGVVGCDLRLARLVDIAKAEKFRAQSADVSHLKHRLAELPFNVEIEVLGVGSAEIVVGAEEVTEGRKT